MTRPLHLALVVAALTSFACHPGPVIDTGPKPPSAGGTIAGLVSADGNAPVAGRKVTAIHTGTGQRYEATTAGNGGYTIKVPEGTYRLELQLRGAEKLVRQPDETRITNSDLDTRRDFVITGGGNQRP